MRNKLSVSFGDESHEFNFSKFNRKLHEKELPSKDELIGLASIAVPPTNPLEQYLLDHENEFHEFNFPSLVESIMKKNFLVRMR